MNIKTWEDFKSLIDSRKLNINWIEYNKHYHMIAFDGPFKITYIMPQNNDAAHQDFESNYKDSHNKKLDLGQTAFAAKKTKDGKDLFARERGVPGVTIAPGDTGQIIHAIEHPAAKINGAEIYGCKLGDTVNFKVLDTTTGTYTGQADFMLNQFGFDVNMPNDKYVKQYPYDADLLIGMQICAEYKNNGSEDITVYMNLDIHEVK